MDRVKVLEAIAKDIGKHLDKERGLLVAVDGPDGAGKSMFAAGLTNYLKEHGITVLHVSVDGFHQPRAKRYIRGRRSPEGFFRDSYDYDEFKAVLLMPFLKKGERRVQTAIHDVETDKQLSPDPVFVQPETVLIVDGIFLHRDELFKYWDYSIFLDVDFQHTFGRISTRDNVSPDPFDESNNRYRESQLLYFEECDPKSRATIVIDNNDFEHPKIVSV